MKKNNILQIVINFIKKWIFIISLYVIVANFIGLAMFELFGYKNIFIIIFSTVITKIIILIIIYRNNKVKLRKEDLIIVTYFTLLNFAIQLGFSIKFQIEQELPDIEWKFFSSFLFCMFLDYISFNIYNTQTLNTLNTSNTGKNYGMLNMMNGSYNNQNSGINNNQNQHTSNNKNLEYKKHWKGLTNIDFSELNYGQLCNCIDSMNKELSFSRTLIYGQILEMVNNGDFRSNTKTEQGQLKAYYFELACLHSRYSELLTRVQSPSDAVLRLKPNSNQLVSINHLSQKIDITNKFLDITVPTEKGDVSLKSLINSNNEDDRKLAKKIMMDQYRLLRNHYNIGTSRVRARNITETFKNIDTSNKKIPGTLVTEFERIHGKTIKEAFSQYSSFRDNENE